MYFARELQCLGALSFAVVTFFSKILLCLNMLKINLLVPNSRSLSQPWLSCVELNWVSFLPHPDSSHASCSAGRDPTGFYTACDRLTWFWTIFSKMLVKYSHAGACTLEGDEGEGSFSSSLIKIIFLSKKKVKLLSSKDLGSLTSRFLSCNATHYMGERSLWTVLSLLSSVKGRWSN